jgi:hypothetical protein
MHILPYTRVFTIGNMAMSDIPRMGQHKLYLNNNLYHFNVKYIVMFQNSN